MVAKKSLNIVQGLALSVKREGEESSVVCVKRNGDEIVLGILLMAFFEYLDFCD